MPPISSAIDSQSRPPQATAVELSSLKIRRQPLTPTGSRFLLRHSYGYIEAVGRCHQTPRLSSITFIAVDFSRVVSLLSVAVTASRLPLGFHFRYWPQPRLHADVSYFTFRR